MVKIKEIIGCILLLSWIVLLILFLYTNIFSFQDYRHLLEDKFKGMGFIFFLISIIGVWKITNLYGNVIFNIFFKKTKKEIELSKAIKKIEDKYKKIKLEEKLNKLKEKK